MRNFVLLFAILVGTQCFAFDVVYPKKHDVIINSDSTFFIGSSKLPLKINGQNVPLHPSGGFAYVVELDKDVNTFVLESDDDTQIYIIKKPKLKESTCNSPKFIPYEKEKIFYVTTDKAPLRSTPVDAGINRMAHLPQNTELRVDGEKSGFYRVVLGQNNFGWISKSDVKQCTVNNFELAELSGYDYIDSDEYFTFIFHFNKKVPFEILEGDVMQIRFFNVKDNPENIYLKDFPFNEASCGAKLMGYSGEYVENDFIWKIRKPIHINPKRPLRDLKIAIDAGHGGTEIGAIGCLNDKEKDVNLIFAKKLETELKKRGAKVFMTRSDDSYSGLKERVDIANREDALVLLSLHANALPDGADPNKNSGTSIYYYYNQSKPLADSIMKSVTSQTEVNNDKVRQGSLALVRNTNALSLLIEISYMINPSDNANLINPEFQDKYIKAVADGLEGYFLKSLSR